MKKSSHNFIELFVIFSLVASIPLTNQGCKKEHNEETIYEKMEGEYEGIKTRQYSYSLINYGSDTIENAITEIIYFENEGKMSAGGFLLTGLKIPPFSNDSFFYNSGSYSHPEKIKFYAHNDSLAWLKGNYFPDGHFDITTFTGKKIE